MPKRKGRKSAAQTPAPPSDRISGSKVNPKGSASSEQSAKGIVVSDKTLKSLKDKLQKFKKENPNNKKVNINDLKAVFRRGAGAYSKSHRPTITGGAPNTRTAWAMARVNKFLKKAGGEKVKAAYVQDDDLMARGGGLPAKGDCYYAAGQFVMGVFSPKKIDYIGTPYLVHAEVKGQGELSHIRYGHAWIEDDVMVYDFSNGREIVIPKAIYYKVGDIKTKNPKKYHKYTFAEARSNMVKTGHYGCWDIETDYEKGGMTDEAQKETYKKWKSLVNMSKSELERFYNSEEGKEAGLSAREAANQGINSGRESARWIMRMKDTPVKEWTPDMWRWAKKQISFISRMSGNRGGLYDGKGNKTRKHLSLLIWGNNPKKK